MDWAAWWTRWGDLVWGSLIGAALTIVFGYIFYRMAEKSKRLTYEIRSQNRIIQASKDQRQHLKVLYKGQKVQNPSITIVRIGNTGKEPILDEDFKSAPVSIKFVDDVAILAYDITRRTSPDISGAFSQGASDNELKFLPVLLNRDEWLDLQVVTDGEVQHPEMTGRFAGQTQPFADVSTIGKPPLWVRLPLHIVFIAAFAIGTFSIFTLGELSGWRPALGVVGAAYFAVLQFRSSFWTLRSRWREPKQEKD